MYLIIVEGTDNIGKDTVINRLIENFNSVSLIHCHGPQSKIFPNYEQDKQFIDYARAIQNGYYDATECIIMNRSHYGEYVYGQIYRDRDKKSIIEMIDKVDEILLSREDLKIKYIQLVSSSVSLRIRNEDHKSLSEMDTNKMQNETELFCEIYEYSKLDKTIINVSNGHDEFRYKEDIYNDVIKFINK